MPFFYFKIKKNAFRLIVSLLIYHYFIKHDNFHKNLVKSVVDLTLFEKKKSNFIC